MRISAMAAAGLLLLGAPSLAAPVETITIEAENALPGIWRFPPHERQTAWTVADAKFSVMGPNMYCRIGHSEGRYTFDCLELAERSAHATLEATASGHVGLSWRLLWGAPQCHWVFDGRLQSKTEISGRLGSACPIRDHEDSRWKAEPLTITKMVLSETIADVGGQAPFLRHLLEQMARGRVTEPYVEPHFVSSNPEVVPLPDDVQQRLLVFPTPDSLRPLGKVKAVIYISDYFPIVGWWGRAHYRFGTGHKPNSPVFGDRRPIYAVEFENGERLCTLHRRGDGILDHFQCL